MRTFATYLALLLVLATPALSQPDRGYRFTGRASSYGWGDGFNGRRTASGERFYWYGYTAASRSLPFGTWVKVTNVDPASYQRKNRGKSVYVRINDRGPAKWTRKVLDISEAAARQIGMDGACLVEIKVLSKQEVQDLRRRGIIR